MDIYVWSPIYYYSVKKIQVHDSRLGEIIYNNGQN